MEYNAVVQLGNTYCEWWNRPWPDDFSGSWVFVRVV